MTTGNWNRLYNDLVATIEGDQEGPRKGLADWQKRLLEAVDGDKPLEIHLNAPRGHGRIAADAFTAAIQAAMKAEETAQEEAARPGAPNPARGAATGRPAHPQHRGAL